MIENVETLDDPRLDAFARLTEAQLRSKLEPEKALFIAESQKVIERAFEGGMEPISLLMEEKWLPPMAPLIERMEERDNGIFDIEATIVCERESHKGIVIGKGGSMLKKIGTAARIEIENLMDAKVNLQLWVKVRREWRDSELYMKNYGYNPRDI